MKKKNLINKNGSVRELTRKDIRAMKPAKEVLSPELLAVLPKRKVGQRGAQKSPIKVPVTIRYSAEVVDYFKAEGAGWQAKINDVLKVWIKEHPKRSTSISI